MIKLRKTQAGNRRIYLLCIAFLVLPSAQAQIHIIPQPLHIKATGKSFVVKKSIAVWTDPQFASSLQYFRRLILSKYGVTSYGSADAKAAELYLAKDGNIGKEGYRISMTEAAIKIYASESSGVINALSSVDQLLAGAESMDAGFVLPALEIEDKPRFSWRGFMLDESRHFFGKEKVKSLLDWMAFYKLNKFHWHLTDEPAWRLTIQRYPWLTQIGGIGNYLDPYAAPQYYSQADISEIINYAAERNIEVVPEIDMPGHATAANRAYPFLSGGGNDKHPDFTFHPAKNSTYSFLTNVLREVKSLFPSDYVHLGGDEVAFGSDAWNSDSKVQELKRSAGLKTNKAVEEYFIRRMADSVAEMNGKIIVWDEMADAGLSADRTIMMWWRHDKPEQLNKVLSKGYQTLLTPRLPMYFDFVQQENHRYGRKWGKAFNPLLGVYNFAGDELDSLGAKKGQILGIQANLWTETVTNTNRLDYLVFPRIAALAEAAWTPGGKRNFEQFSTTLKKHLLLYRDQGLYYFDPFKDGNPEPAVIRKSQKQYMDHPN